MDFLEMIFNFFSMVQNITLTATGGGALYFILCALLVTIQSMYFLVRDIFRLFKKMENNKKAKQ